MLARRRQGRTAYADAVAIYLAFVVEQRDYYGSTCDLAAAKDNTLRDSAKQALPMAWDYAEGIPFGVRVPASWTVRRRGREGACKRCIPAIDRGHATQGGCATPVDHAAACRLSTDPPYYDNIGYADLSDFFYVWLRRTLRDVFPDLFATVAVPKAEELVATPYRHGSKGRRRHSS